MLQETVWKRFVIKFISSIIRMVIRLPVGILAGLVSLIMKLSGDSELKETLEDVYVVLKGGPPGTVIAKNMVLKARKEDLYALLYGSLYNVD